MRSFLIGLFSGFVLSALRAPQGLELLQVPATAAGAAMAYRATALLVIAVGLILGLKSTSERFSSTLVLVGIGVGYQLHWQLMDSPGMLMTQVVLSLLLVTLLVAGHRGGGETRPGKQRTFWLVCAALIGWRLIDLGFPESHGESVLAGFAGLLSLAIIGRNTGRLDTSQDMPLESSPASGSLTGIAICGAGSALMIEGLARHLRLFGAGLSSDDSVFGTVFLSFAIFGAFAFARPFLASRRRPLVFAVLAAFSGLAAWGSLRVIGNLATHEGLDIYLRNAPVEADLSLQGMMLYDVLLAAPILVLPAFFGGSLIALMGRPIELAALSIGAAVGLLGVPQLLHFDWSSSLEGVSAITESNSVELALLGGTIAAVGALVYSVSSSQLSRFETLIGTLAAFLGIGMCQFPPHEAIQILSPWERREPQTLAVHETPDGLITIERDAQGEPFATLNRRALTAKSQEVTGDLQRIDEAFSMLGKLDPDAAPSVLFVGQLDPSRALRLKDLGAGRIDRSAAWSTAMGMLEKQLFGGTPKWFKGEILDLASARQKLEQGQYDLVIVAPLAGPSPTTRNLASPPDTTVVIWLDTAFGLEDEHLGQRILLNVDGLTELHAGLVRGPQVEAVQLAGGFGAPGFVDAGDPIDNSTAMLTLSTRQLLRGDLHRQRFCERLAAAETTPGMATGLALHFKAQGLSSPFLTDAEKVELDPAANDLFSAAASAPEPDALAIEVIESLAFLLSAQRQAPEIDRVLTRPAARHQPWPALEIALAHASLEFLEPGAALESLARAHSAFPGSLVSLTMWAEAQGQTGDDAAAVKSLERALLLAPQNPELERRLAVALQRAGDPRGAAALKRALERAPQDSQLLQHQSGGPYPPLPGGYHPLPGGPGEHEH